MQGLKYFKKSDFEKTNFSYSELNPLRLKFLKLGKREFGRLRYNLPNGKLVDYSKIPDECETHIRTRLRVEKELEKLLRSGYFPIKDVSKLCEVMSAPKRKGNNPTIDEAIELYYTKFNSGKNEKKAKVIRNEIGCMRYNMRFFKEVLNKHYIHDVTSKDLGDYCNV